MLFLFLSLILSLHNSDAADKRKIQKLDPEKIINIDPKKEEDAIITLAEMKMVHFHKHVALHLSFQSTTPHIFKAYRSADQGMHLENSIGGFFLIYWSPKTCYVLLNTQLGLRLIPLKKYPQYPLVATFDKDSIQNSVPFDKKTFESNDYKIMLKGELKETINDYLKNWLTTLGTQSAS